MKFPVSGIGSGHGCAFIAKCLSAYLALFIRVSVVELLTRVRYSKQDAGAGFY